MRRVALIALPALMGLQACAPSATVSEINRAPDFTAVGASLRPSFDPPVPVATFPPAVPSSRYSLYAPQGPGLYQDARAMSIGDILTIEISLDDAARLDNRSDRLRESETDLDVAFGLGNILNLFGVTGGGTVRTESESSALGEGSIDRSELLDTTVAAVVTSVLPNGNLVIRGTQEVRVNNEMRVLAIAGIVRPRDIGTNNTIPYEKIAEARISYGGRGRITEIQQPPWGQQVYDVVVPF